LHLLMIASVRHCEIHPNDSPQRRRERRGRAEKLADLFTSRETHTAGGKAASKVSEEKITTVLRRMREPLLTQAVRLGTQDACGPRKANVAWTVHSLA